MKIMEPFYRGAEAVLSKNSGTIVKERPPKRYRIEKLDNALRQRRTRQEAKLLREAKRAGVTVPRVIDESITTIRLEYIEGDQLKNVLARGESAPLAKLGKAIALLHNAGIVHGDLTTSNVLVTNDVVLIDFGLAFRSQKAEDKATDLYVLFECLRASHADAERLWTRFQHAYVRSVRDGSEVIKAFAKIKKRRRYAR